MIDEELRELEEIVHEVTGWEDCNVEYNISKGITVYHYSSDYLLKKLPAPIEIESYRNQGNNTRYTASKWNWQETLYRSDSPVKSLLMLCLALKEAGEL